MKPVVIFVIILLLATPSVSADSSWNPIEIGKNMVSDGIVDAFRSLADEIMGFVCGSTEEGEGEDEAHDSVTTMIINFATWGVKPFSYPSVVKMMGVSFVVGLGMLITYFFVGAGSATLKDRMSNYGKNSVYGILLMSFAPMLIWIALLFAKVLKTMMMESIADSISPSIENCVILYFMMAVMWLLVAVFFGISNIVICITAALSFVIGGLYASDKTRHVATWMIDYFVTMVVMQILVITVAVVVVGFMMDIKSGGTIITPGLEAATYVGMILLILIMCIFMTFGKALVMKTAKKAVLLVI